MGYLISRKGYPVSKKGNRFPELSPQFFNNFHFDEKAYLVSPMGYPVFRMEYQVFWMEYPGPGVPPLQQDGSQKPIRETRHSFLKTRYPIREIGYLVWKTKYPFRETGNDDFSGDFWLEFKNLNTWWVLQYVLVLISVVKKIEKISSLSV